MVPLEATVLVDFSPPPLKAAQDAVHGAPLSEEMVPMAPAEFSSHSPQAVEDTGRWLLALCWCCEPLSWVLGAVAAVMLATDHELGRWSEMY